MARQGPSESRLNAGILPNSSNIEHVFEQAADIALHIDGDGIVLGISVSPECPTIGCLDHWVGRDINGFLTIESREKLAKRVDAMRGDALLVPRPIELNHVDNATWEFPIRYTLHRVADSDSILLLGRDMQPIAEVQQRLVKEQMARERDQQALKGETAFYRVVLEASETPLILVDPQQGRIRDLNSAAAALLGTKVDTLTGGSFAQALEGRRPAELLEALRSSAEAEGAEGIEVTARRNGAGLKIRPQYFRAAGNLFILCRVDPVHEESTGSAEIARSLSALFNASSDAIVLATSKGVIREANEAFLILVDAAQMRHVRDTSLADFLVRGAIDLKLILDTANAHGKVTRYSAQVTSAVGARTNVEISATRLGGSGGDIGYGLIIRQQSLNEPVGADTGGMAMSDEAMQNVMSLVGTASLKELVSATSDVVEKICIETAVQMTDNNRVAAAEILGLSRQSLYVKLRKHGLINGDDED